jgi:hypothetical protein
MDVTIAEINMSKQMQSLTLSQKVQGEHPEGQLEQPDH